MRVALLLTPLLVVACGGGSDLPALTDATSLACPSPGALPFRLMSTGFQNPAAQTLATSDTRIKDEASDAMGNPNGANANVFLADTASPATGDIDYHGVKAVTTTTNGISGNGLAGEYVSLWTYDPAMAEWLMLDRQLTGSDGSYDFPSTGYTAANGQPVYAMLEANGTCTEHYTDLLPSGTKVVVVDIDGTLTLSNDEFDEEIGDPTYVPKQMGAALALVQAWMTKGYQVVYLTARPHVFRTETREWLTGQGFPIGPVITENDFEDARTYKALWLNRMIGDFGWVAEAVYGNEDSDIQAYGDAGIASDITFIVGPSGGDLGSVAIPGLDFTSHIQTFVDAQPDNAPKSAD